MKNSKLRRALLLFACAVLLVCLSVGATLAYLTSVTPMVKNTFTVGKVILDDPTTEDLNEGLDEADTDEYGDLYDANGRLPHEDDYDAVNLADRVQENTYKLLPGHKYVKDPVVYVQPKSEPCLVYVIVDDPINPIIDYQNISQQMAAEWEIVGSNGTKTLYGYKTVVDARNATDPIPLDTFKYIKIKTDVSNETLATYAGKMITIKAFAIQKDGLIAGEQPTWAELRSIWETNFAATHLVLDAIQPSEPAE